MSADSVNICGEIDPGHFVWFQPLVAAASGRPLSAEALARTYTFDGRIISAGDLFAVDRTSPSELLLLDRQTFRRVGRQLRSWAKVGFTPRLNVNVSTTTIAMHPDCVLMWLADEQLEPTWLTIEVTETAPVEDIAAVATAVERFRRAGLRVAIDDFGSGSATMELLSRVEADELKIDQRFVLPLIRDERSRRMVSSMVRLAHDLRMDVVAEGVESPQHWDWLTDIGCDAVQGHAVAMPMSANALLRWRPPLTWSARAQEG
jgi:EAL domain-containing protein (putative c-di-GMP-specific phosphodiesterase class I)